MNTILDRDAGLCAGLFGGFDSAHVAARQLIPGSVTSIWRIAGERKAQRAARKAASRSWSSSPAWGSYTDLVLRGMGGAPMVNRKAGVPRVRGTRTPTIAAVLLVCSMTALRKGRGLLLSGFASEVLAPCSITSRPDKWKLFALKCIKCCHVSRETYTMKSLKQIGDFMKIQQAKDYFEAGVITGFDAVRDPLKAGGWLLVISGTNGKSWTFQTSLGQDRSFAKLDTLIGEIESICGSVSSLHVSI